jgi:hypothetical protein
MTGDCVCLLDGEEKADLQEDRGEKCELLKEYEEATKASVL